MNPAPAQSLPDSLLSLVDIITPNETEAEHLTGIAVNDNQGAQDAAEALQKGISKVMITLVLEVFGIVKKVQKVKYFCISRKSSGYYCRR